MALLQSDVAALIGTLGSGDSVDLIGNPVHLVLQVRAGLAGIPVRSG